MRRFILTGTAGAGKTSLIRSLERKGHFVVDEAATDVIALEQSLGVPEPWTNPIFIDQIVGLQKQRQIQSSMAKVAIQFFDRSPIDAYALCMYLKFTPSAALLEELERIKKDQIYQKDVFFIENLGFCQPTEARKISFEEALVFERIHEEAYAKWNYNCIKVPAASIEDRTNKILEICLK